jgi:ParB family transcriptional regulator, chromosome partitioning protein
MNKPSAPVTSEPDGTPEVPTVSTSTEPTADSTRPQSRRMVPVSDLAAHPGNVRTDLNLTPEFLASIASEGVRIPLLITEAQDGGWRVIEGHRRLAAAIQAGLAEVPCDIDSARAGDEAGQYLDMLLANADSYRANYRAGEEAAALFAAAEAGATRTRLRKATGRTAAQVKTAIAAGSLPAETRARAAELDAGVTLDQLALLAEFSSDQDAIDRLLRCLDQRYPMEHVAERIRQERAEAAEHARLVAELEAAGVPVTDALPAGAAWLTDLTNDGEAVTPGGHAACPGHGATFSRWNQLEVCCYCTDPAAHGHASRWAPRTRTGSGPDGDPADTGTPSGTGLGSTADPAGREPAGPDRRLVVAGNKAWEAAARVRRRWLAASLFSRRSAPREAHLFLASQLLAMPLPLRSHLAAARRDPLLATLAGHQPDQLDAECATATTGRLAILALAPLITAYEHAMGDGDGRNTWRTDRYSPCPRADAATYLAFLASVGYQPAAIEQAVINGTPYAGDTPPITPLTDADQPDPDSQPEPPDSASQPDDTLTANRTDGDAAEPEAA